MSSPKPHQGFMQLSPFLPPPLQTVFHLLSLIVLSCLSFFPWLCRQPFMQTGFGDRCLCHELSKEAGCSAERAHRLNASSRAEMIQAPIQLRDGLGSDFPAPPLRSCWIIAAGWESPASPSPPTDTTCSSKWAGKD